MPAPRAPCGGRCTPRGLTVTGPRGVCSLSCTVDRNRGSPGRRRLLALATGARLPPRIPSVTRTLRRWLVFAESAHCRRWTRDLGGHRLALSNVLTC
jgi:hypothetical protein